MHWWWFVQHLKFRQPSLDAKMKGLGKLPLLFDMCNIYICSSRAIIGTTLIRSLDAKMKGLGKLPLLFDMCNIYICSSRAIIGTTLIRSLDAKMKGLGKLPLLFDMCKLYMQFKSHHWDNINFSVALYINVGSSAACCIEVYEGVHRWSSNKR